MLWPPLFFFFFLWAGLFGDYNRQTAQNQKEASSFSGNKKRSLFNFG